MEEDRQKKRKKNEDLYLEDIPDNARYIKSYPNHGIVTALAIQPGKSGEFIVTGTQEGYVKIWRKGKKDGELEFLKQFLAHSENNSVVDCNFSGDGRYFITISTDGTGKIFDVEGLDMISFIEFGFEPRKVCWVHHREVDRIIVSERGTGKIHLYDAQQPDDEGSTDTIEKLHKQSVGILEYNDHFDCMVSGDDSGMIEYWQPIEPYEKPQGLFDLKSDTDLYTFRKRKQQLDQLVISPDGKLFAVAIGERAYLFKFLKGKLIKEYIPEEDSQGNSKVRGSVTFDKSSKFLFHTTNKEIRQVKIATGEVSNRLGTSESIQYSHIVLHQGNPNMKKVLTVEMATSENNLIAESQLRHPLLLATAVKSDRLYVFNKSASESSTDISHRDIPDDIKQKKNSTNANTDHGKEQEKPTMDYSSSTVTIHTTVGDIKVDLFPKSAPLAVENFVELCRKNYYDNTPFHRIIKRFMVQGGDPDGDGTGGESIWGRPFKDEFDPALRHDKPYRLSMANAGKNTNGSQFFITTEKTPWLDDKHTIFGTVVSGFDIVQKIENLPTNKNDKPLDPPTIISTNVQ